MDNVFNFRDLGGIPTADGRKVKSGLFFRSGLLDFANDNDIAFLKTLGLLEVFDYRDRDELDKTKSIFTSASAQSIFIIPTTSQRAKFSSCRRAEWKECS